MNSSFLQESGIVGNGSTRFVMTTSLTPALSPSAFASYGATSGRGRIIRRVFGMSCDVIGRMVSHQSENCRRLLLLLGLSRRSAAKAEEKAGMRASVKPITVAARVCDPQSSVLKTLKNILSWFEISPLLVFTNQNEFHFAIGLRPNLKE